ncbi:bifunctional diaminohydroxyphosphoribosylaminopyrimidine deaminase/5-amino-6-(5-phosphoribosylamino)uracil reductase RibD [Legionella dresdenensis]|uniref:Riboflavin biosynthesis protein RibD n=1 Tax=Legionella dresdenensis TaxID=450200 RepID=A0ABV8CDU0_9GAMM
MHRQFMIAALEQAWNGRGFCAPNPAVGAVVVHNDKIIASGWHHGVGTAHAEQAALQQLSEYPNDITLYVTLEPCNHWGRTPPCVSGIIAAGVKRVVYGYPDPNPVVAANNTPQILKENGIEVIHYPLAEIDQFYQSYSWWTRTRKPWVTAKIAQSLDGKIAARNGQPVKLSNDACAQFTHQQRLHSDIILTSSKTVINDNPRLNARLKDKIYAKPIAVIDSDLAVKATAEIFTTAQFCRIFHAESVQPEQKIANCDYHAVKMEKGRLDLHQIITHLGSLGYHDVWVEAGGELFSALHKQGLINKTYLYIVPRILGNAAISAYHDDIFQNREYDILWQPFADNMIVDIVWQERECVHS